MNVIIVIRTCVMCINDYDVYYYAIFTSFLSICCFLLAFDSVIKEIISELVTFYLISLIILVRQIAGFFYNVYELFIASPAPNPSCVGFAYFKWEYLLMMVVGILANIYYTSTFYFVQKEYGTVAVYFIGIEQKIIAVYKRYLLFRDALLLDCISNIALIFMMFWFGSVGSYKVLVHNAYDWWDYTLISVFGIIPIILFPLAVVIFKREYRGLSVMYLIFLCFWPLVLIVESILMYFLKPRNHVMKPLRQFYIISGASFGTIWRIITIILGIIAILDFGKGLKEKFYPRVVHPYKELEQEEHGYETKHSKKTEKKEEEVEDGDAYN